MTELEGFLDRKMFKNKVPPQIEELAYAESAALDAKDTIQNAHDVLQAGTLEIMTELSEDEALNHDDFLKKYQELLLMGGPKLPRVAQFERALNIREKLVPGEFLLLPNDTIVTIQQPTPEDDIDTIRPKIKYDENMKTRLDLHNGDIYRDVVYLYWDVAIKEDDGRVEVKDISNVGYDAILEKMDYTWSKFPYDPDLLVLVPSAVENYEKIGEVEKAEALKKVAIAHIEDYFNKNVFAHRPFNSFDAIFVPESLNVIRRLSPESYSTIIDNTKKYAASGKYTGNIIPIIKNVASEAVKDEVRTHKRTEYKRPTPAQVAQLFADFTKEGENLLTAENN